jgi:hypothetical protein
MVDKDDISFSYRGYLCIYFSSADIWHTFMPINSVLSGVLPTFLVIATTFYLLIRGKKVRRRGRESLKWQGIITTVLTATVYCISILPYAAYELGKRFLEADNEKNAFFFIYLQRAGVSLLSLNTISNFYIYSLTVSSFRSFVCSKMQQAYRFLSKLVTSTDNGKYLKLNVILEDFLLFFITTNFFLDHVANLLRRKLYYCTPILPTNQNLQLRISSDV